MASFIDLAGAVCQIERTLERLVIEPSHWNLEPSYFTPLGRSNWFSTIEEIGTLMMLPSLGTTLYM